MVALGLEPCRIGESGRFPPTLKTSALSICLPIASVRRLCSYPEGSDPEEPFIEIVWWVNQELLHHGAEIALLRDLYRMWSG